MCPKLRDLSDSPDPGKEFNCRCWVEFVEKADDIKDNKKTCMQLNIDLQNARLQLKSELDSMLEADKRAKELRPQLEAAWDKFQKEIRESGFDISTSLIPGINGNIPILEPILETAKNAAEIWAAYQEYRRLWDELRQAIDDQKYFQRRAENKEKDIVSIQGEMKKQGCDS